VSGVLAQAVHDLRTRQLRRPRGRAAARAHPAAAAAPMVPPPKSNCAPARRAPGCLGLLCCHTASANSVREDQYF